MISTLFSAECIYICIFVCWRGEKERGRKIVGKGRKNM